MPDRTEIARTYFEAFSRSDHEAILALLSEDVVWDIHGHRHIRGKAEFDAEIENENFAGPPQLTVDRIINAGDTVAVPHEGEVRQADGTPFRFAACDILTFNGDLITRVESWVVPITRGGSSAGAPRLT